MNGSKIVGILLAAVLLVAAFTAGSTVMNGREIAALQSDITHVKSDLGKLPPGWLTSQISGLQQDVKELTKKVSSLEQRILEIHDKGTTTISREIIAHQP